MVLNDEEILVKDKTGKFKILRGGKFYDLEENISARPQAPATSDEVREILKQVRFKIDESLKARLADIVEACLKDVRDKFETKSILIRETKSGGMGFFPEQADIVINLINKVGNKKEKEEKEEKTSLPIVEIKAESKKEKIKKEEGRIEVEDKKVASTITPPEKTELEKKVEEILEESGIKLPESEERRLKSILLTNLKDIRDDYELQDVLSIAFSEKVLSKEKRNKILEIARKKIKGGESDLRKTKLEEIKEALEAEQRRREVIFEESQNKLNDKLKNRWQEITKRKESFPISLPEESIVRPEKERPEILSLVEFADFLDSKGEKKKDAVLKEMQGEETPSQVVAEKKTTPAPMSLDKSAIVQAPASAKATAGKPAFTNIPASEPKPLQVFKPVNIPIRRPPPVFRKDQPRLDDIKYVPRIVGPIDELRDMTLVNFRRFGASPGEAVEKIKEKLNILEQDSVIKRLAGVKAFQESEVTKIYLEISRDCLSKGASADQVISLRESLGRPTLTIAEYRAILELNKFLRY